MPLDSYTYDGPDLVLDKHNDEYEIDFQKGDKFTHTIRNGMAVIVHEIEPKLEFQAKLTDAKYKKLMRYSECEENLLHPHPKFPAYPNIKTISMDILPKLYALYNKKFFNDKCPKHVLFKKGNQKAVLGLATLRSGALADSSDFYKLTVNLKSIGSDPILFIDVLLHEMIHLYLYRLGMDYNDKEALVDGHGPRFQAEMRRLNAKGFNISTTLDWEKREVSDADIYYVKVLHGHGMRVFWTYENLERELETVYNNIVRDLDRHAKVTIGVTSDIVIRKYHRLLDSLRPPKAHFAKSYDNVEFKGRVLLQRDFEFATHTEILIPKKIKEQLFLPYTLFDAFLKQHGYKFNPDTIRRMWVSADKKEVLSHTFERLDDVYDALDVGMKDVEIRRRLNYIYSCCESRLTHSDYRISLTKYIISKGYHALLNYKELGL
jgi:hypothetical protein